MTSEEYQNQADELKDISTGDSIEAQRVTSAANAAIGEYAATEERRKDERKEAMGNLGYATGPSGGGTTDENGLDLVRVVNIAAGLEAVRLADSSKNKSPGFNYANTYFSGIRLVNLIGISICIMIVVAYIIKLVFFK